MINYLLFKSFFLICFFDVLTDLCFLIFSPEKSNINNILIDVNPIAVDCYLLYIKFKMFLIQLQISLLNFFDNANGYFFNWNLPKDDLFVLNNSIYFCVNDLYFILPEIFFIIFFIYLFIFNLFFSNSKKFFCPSTLKCSIIFCLFFFFILSFMYFTCLNITINSIFLFNNQFLISKFILFFKFLLSIALFCFFLLIKKYVILEKFKNYEFLLILLLSSFGMYILMSCNDFLIFYLALELQSLALFVLAAYKKFSIFSIEAGLKYFILGGFSSGLLLFGISLLYGLTGIINFSDLSLFLYFFFNSTQEFFYIFLLFFSFLLIIISLFFKLGLAPFHLWVVDVYEGAPTIITAFFAIITKISLVLILFRFIQNFFIFCPLEFYLNFFILCGILSIFIGTFGAILQTKIKRMLAYSTISHVGFMILGFATLSFNGFFSVIFYLITYIILSFSIFGSLIALRQQSFNFAIKNIIDLKNIYNTNPFLAIIFTLTLFSLAGIPPLMGFFSKFFIFLALIEQEKYFVVIIALILSVIGAFYYIRLIKIMLFNSDKSDYLFLNNLSFTEKILLFFSCFLNCAFFFCPNVLMNFLIQYSNLYFLTFI